METIVKIADVVAYGGGLGFAALMAYCLYEAIRDRIRARRGLGLRSISG